VRNRLFLIFCAIVYCHRPAVENHNFVLVSECHLPGYSKDLDIQGDYAYIANDQGGLKIVDISNPESTLVVGDYVGQTVFQSIAVRDSFAYVGYIGYLDDKGLMIFNIQNPKAPSFISQDPTNRPYQICAPECKGDTQYIYIAASYWFIIEDVSWPQFPSKVRWFATPGNVRSLFVADSIVFLTCEQVGVIVYNLNNPDSTARIGEIDTPSNARDIFVSGLHAYVADGYGGLVIIDITNIDSMEIVGIYNTPGYAQGVFVEGNLAYVADGTGGVQVIDVSTPESPVLYGKLSTPYAYNLKVGNGIIYLVDRDMGLVIIKEEISE